MIVTGVGPLSTDTYIAGMPDLQRSLNTSAVIAQLTLTAFIIGIAAGQVAFGPLSDGRGRRGLLIGGAITFTVASAICAIAPTGALLVAARLFQGLAAGCGVAVGRAVVGDVYRGAEAAKRYGTLAAIVFLGPVIAPAVGGVILSVGDWRTVFAALTGFGGLMVAAVWFALPETLPPVDRHGGGLRDTVGRMTDLLGDWRFMRQVTVQCFAIAGFFTYIGGSSFVLETVYDLSVSRYATIFGTNAAAMAVSSMLFRFAVTRAGAARLRLAGLSLATTGALGLVVVGLIERTVLPPLGVPWALLCCVTFGMGLVIPASTTLGQQAGDRARGTASALLGGISFFVGALVTPLTGVVGYTSMLPMGVLMAGFFVTAGALALRVQFADDPDHIGEPVALPV
ncbi:MAG TPA: multidrug effflux MFS transporter [Kineosporiaceae bacterium]|nr:multidrug effflux MFS transporter [Kineosporiaceae bacterium]